jgi:Arc/MetJ-type ribon-helix-helix transcriptional regulator
MTIELTPEQERLIDLAVQSGAYHDSEEVISAALAMLAEDIEDGAISKARSAEPRFSLDEVEAELQSISKLR